MIQIDNLAFSYGAAPVLKNITMKLEEGRIYGLLGENGVGKTTLLTLLAGLKRPNSGIIQVDGQTPFRREPSLLSLQYYLPDEVAPVPMKAEAFARATGVFWPRFSMDDFLSLMKELETDSTKRMDAMSAGQLKKTYISFALACHPKYLYLDEPTNGLDIPSKSQFRAALMRYTSEDAVVVVSTHQVRDLENVIDPIVILDKQDVLLNASLEEVSSKLFFDYGQELHPDALYCEQLPGGFIQVCPNTTGADSKVNIEALFNAVHRNKEIVKSLFKA
ncbi:MAG: ATP-binding cassette domain-containing protein [Bacteroidales bacterium]|nr:ATP-binding cassette domain-containing protein [Bacteroidales bacterium]